MLERYPRECKRLKERLHERWVSGMYGSYCKIYNRFVSNILYRWFIFTILNCQYNINMYVYTESTIYTYICMYVISKCTDAKGSSAIWRHFWDTTR